MGKIKSIVGKAVCITFIPCHLKVKTIKELHNVQRNVSPKG